MLSFDACRMSTTNKHKCRPLPHGTVITPLYHTVMLLDCTWQATAGGSFSPFSFKGFITTDGSMCHDHARRSSISVLAKPPQEYSTGKCLKPQLNVSSAPSSCGTTPRTSMHGCLGCKTSPRRPVLVRSLVYANTAVETKQLRIQCHRMTVALFWAAFRLLVLSGPEAECCMFPAGPRTKWVFARRSRMQSVPWCCQCCTRRYAM